MLSIYNHIRNAINEDIPGDYEKAVMFAHVLDGAVSGFLIYNIPKSSFFYGVEECTLSLNTCENVWETERLNGSENLWSAIIYIIDKKEVNYKFLYETDFDVSDLLHREIGRTIEEEHFPNMSYKAR